MVLVSCKDKDLNPELEEEEQPTDTVDQTYVRKVRDITIYNDARFYSAFPSVVRGKNGEFLVAFRRAPDRRIFGEPGSNHVDPNSYLVMVRSTDGENWTKEPELMYAHPFGGSQDPCLLKLRDGTLICTSYSWAFVLPSGVPNLKEPYHMADGRAYFLGGYVIRSHDNGKTWEGPDYPPHIPSEVHYSALGNPLPAYNRGVMYEEEDGRILWVVAVNDKKTPRKISAHLLTSDDKGITWEYACPVATDDTYSFSEASLHKTPKGDIVAFLRTTDMDDIACIARSTDGGKSFQPWEKMDFRGHPLHALRLSDNKVLLTYGYRHEPYGIRARILNPECTDFKTAPEIVLREDGGSTDLGYPWSVQLDENKVLVVYYFNVAGGIRRIAGTILEITHERIVSIRN
ncbi:sialidase family protein [Proteiniphilum sp.]|uniref:sialidase family protein n=1 Tax=Proteiniphilum sp. TaxID=1926877 RepID=UPI002B1EABBD|nr:sialidase family protein [Proteiniphilum sp.]MEA4917214.1 sialidase family protein [Proteiniphilum sp.]